MDRHDKMNHRSQPLNLLPTTTNATMSKSVIEFRRSVVTNKVVACNPTDKENTAQPHHVEEMPDQRMNKEALSTYLETP